MAEQKYFDRYPTFEPDPNAGLLKNFEQLTISNGWQPNSKKHKKERKAYLIAAAETHIESIDSGGAAERLAGLQGLCRELQISPIPTSITQCKKELKKVNVCIIDLIDSRRLHTQVKVFQSYHALQQHVTTRKHFFPLIDGKKKSNGLLKVLLRKILG